MELTILMPCLNEADTLGACIEKARQGLRQAGVTGEILIADNGSKDGSQAIAEKLGARVITVKEKGYGSALRGGIAAAQGKWILMGDADDSYDFLETPRFVAKLQEGFELVQGCRLPSGGGVVKDGAMPFLHRWWGNPMFSQLARWWFHAPIHDVYCGLRGFRKDFQQTLNQRCTGMEFATEMIIKASLLRAKIAEVPITLHPDGRKSHAPHLKTFRDGWRTLRFFLLCTPRWLFLMPGFALIFFGLLGCGLALGRVHIGPAHFDAHTLLFASTAILLGYQSVLFSVFTKAFAIGEGILPADPAMTRFFELVNLEKGLIAGMASLVAGLALLLWQAWSWQASGFGPRDYSNTMRWVIPGATLTALGFQTILSSFFVSILGLRRL